LEPTAPVPAWVRNGGPLSSITWTANELSVVAADADVPHDLPCERGWRALKVAGPLDFGLTGILASLASPLADAGISLFAVSTYDTDYILLKEDRLHDALAVLQAAGHTIEGDTTT
jgi:hypothetical protein